MSITISASGTASPTVGTEDTLATDSTSGVYVLAIDGAAIQIGDLVEIKVYTTILGGGTARVCWKSVIGPSPPITPIVLSPPTPSDLGVTVSIKQVQGTARSFPWKLMRM